MEAIRAYLRIVGASKSHLRSKGNCASVPTMILEILCCESNGTSCKKIQKKQVLIRKSRMQNRHTVTECAAEV